MIGTEIIRAVLKTVFGHEHYVRMYEVIDDDMIRKTAGGYRWEALCA